MKPTARRSVSQAHCVWRFVDRFRFGRHIRRESDAIRMLLEAGYEALEGRSPYAEGEAKPDGAEATKKAAARFPQRRPK